MAEFNPYQPPGAGGEADARSTRWPLAIILRALAVVAGFALLADPFPASVVDRRIRVGAKVGGTFLLMLAFIPYGRRAPAEEDPGSGVEEL